LVLEAGEEYKEVYKDIFDEENNSLDTEDFLSIKKAVFLYDWMGEKEIRELEEGHKIYGGSIRKLGEGFSWLADALGGVAENLGWDGDNKRGSGKDAKSVLTEEDKIKKDNLEKIKVLSERLAWGVEEEGLGLARLHIPGLGRSYIGALLREGYDDRKCLEQLGEEELAKVVPKRLAERIKNRYPTVLSSSFTKNDKPKTKNLLLESCNLKPETRNLQPESCNSQLASCSLQPVLEIDVHRPDRIIFEGKEVKVTAKEFSLIHLLAQNKGKILTHNDFLDTIWKESEDATYVQITYHLYKIRRVILKTIGNNKKNKEKIKDVLKVISRRGIMLNLEEDKLKIN